MIFKVMRIFSVLLLATSVVSGQSPASEETALQTKKARAESEKKALALVDVIIKELQTLKLPENRVRIGLGLADALWSRDAKRAHALFKEAVLALEEITAAVAGGAPEYRNLGHLPQQLRQEIVQVAAKHDPRLAADFLRATRPDSGSRPPNSGLTNTEANLQVRVATQIADKDPNEALTIAEESLKIALDYDVLNLLLVLQAKQKSLAERFLDGIVRSIRTYGIGNNAATPIALTIIRTWSENVRATQDPAAPRTTSSLSLNNLNEGMARELASLVVDALIADGQPKTAVAFSRSSIDGPSSLYSGMIQGILYQLKPMLSDVEKLAPDRMPELRARIAEFEKINEAQQGPWVRFRELSETGTPEALIEAAKTAPPEAADGLIQQASWKAINQGDEEGARRLIDQIADPSQRAEMRRHLSRRAFYRATEQKKLAEARGLLSSFTLEEQVTLLAQLATSAAAEGDKPGALKLLSEAQSLLSGRPRNYGQLQGLMHVARAYELLEPNSSLPVVERVIDHANELVAAVVILDGFDVQGYFRSDEFVIVLGNPLNMLAQECGNILASSAQNDMDRARSTAERFSRPEMRLIAMMQIAQTVLARDAAGH